MFAIFPTLEHYLGIDHKGFTLIKADIPVVPFLGRKLDYLFGLGVGNVHNTQRSESMRAVLPRIGVNDSSQTRESVTQHLTNILSDVTNIVSQHGGRTVRESFMMGPAGGVKLQSTWEGTKLITINVFGGK